MRIAVLSDIRFLHGNGDRLVLGAMRGEDPTEAPEHFREAIRWNARQLAEEHEKVLASWPGSIRMGIDGLGEVLFCHATPRNDTDVFTRLTPEDQLLPIFGNLEADVVICGHTHMQFDRAVGKVRVINSGSVGVPFGKPGAYWLLLDPNVQFQHTSYDLTKAASRIRVTSFPPAQEFGDRNVMEPPSEEEMLEAFGKVTLK
jgi:predicted phosphodiesterase